MAGLMMNKAMCMLLIVAVVMISIAPYAAHAAIRCDQVNSSLRPCLSYVTGDSKMDSGCCPGINGLYDAAKTTSDRKSICNCLKSTLKSFTNINYGKAGELPGKCGVSISYKISPTTDCSKVE